MRVSVLIPCYNAERFLALAVHSVLDQCRPGDEIIAIDDGSTDGTAGVLACFMPPLIILRQTNRGVAAALNAGIARATGDVLAFLDADDLWAAGKLSLQLQVFSSRPEIDGVFGHMQNFADPGDGNAEHPPPSAYLGGTLPGLNRGTLLIRRVAFEGVGQLAEDHRHGDFIQWYARAVAAGLRWEMLSELVYFRRIHDANLGIRDRERQREDYLATLKEIINDRRAAATLNRSGSDS